MNVDDEVEKLTEEIKRLGKPQNDGSYKGDGWKNAIWSSCTWDVESLKVLTYDGELLLQGVHDNVEIILKPVPASCRKHLIMHCCPSPFQVPRHGAKLGLLLVVKEYYCNACVSGCKL